MGCRFGCLWLFVFWLNKVLTRNVGSVLLSLYMFAFKSFGKVLVFVASSLMMQYRFIIVIFS